MERRNGNYINGHVALISTRFQAITAGEPESKVYTLRWYRAGHCSAQEVSVPPTEIVQIDPEQGILFIQNGIKRIGNIIQPLWELVSLCDIANGRGDVRTRKILKEHDITVTKPGRMSQRGSERFNPIGRDIDRCTEY